MEKDVDDLVGFGSLAAGDVVECVFEGRFELGDAKGMELLGLLEREHGVVVRVSLKQVERAKERSVVRLAELERSAQEEPAVIIQQELVVDRLELARRIQPNTDQIAGSPVLAQRLVHLSALLGRPGKDRLQLCRHLPVRIIL